MKPPKTWREYVERITFDFPIKTLLKAELDPHNDGERLLVTLAGVPDVYEPGRIRAPEARGTRSCSDGKVARTTSNLKGNLARSRTI